jgi:hypothetical protein
MSIFKGSSEVTSIYVGSTEVQEVYVGSDLVWSSGLRYIGTTLKNSSSGTFDISFPAGAQDGDVYVCWCVNADFPITMPGTTRRSSATGGFYSKVSTGTVSGSSVTISNGLGDMGAGVIVFRNGAYIDSGQQDSTSSTTFTCPQVDVVGTGRAAVCICSPDVYYDAPPSGFTAVDPVTPNFSRGAACYRMGIPAGDFSPGFFDLSSTRTGTAFTVIIEPN